jgi:CAI-1 autoinducer synthase
VTQIKSQHSLDHSGRTNELPFGETDVLRSRVDAYNDRMRDGHLIVGRVPGEGAVQLWNNDYLGLGGHAEIVQAQVDCLQAKSDGVFMSAVFLNETSLQRRFEQQMASYLGAEAAVLCQSGWSANTGLIQALADARTPVYIDQFAHASLWEGVRMAGAQAHVFRHNQPKHLERLIAAHGAGLILVDSIYSSDGSVCPLTDISAISERLDCILVVDESHAIGVYGPHGEGLVHTLGLTAKAHYRTFSLSKAFATRAGMVAGPQRVMTYFPYEARPAIFSSAVLQHEVAGLAATLKVIQEEEWRRQQLWYNTRALRKGLRELGFAVDPAGSQIVALQGGNDAQTRALRDALEERGVFGAVFCAPATPKNHGIVRLSVNARLRDHDIQKILAAAKDIATSRNITPWPKHLMAVRLETAETDAADFAERQAGAAVIRLRDAAQQLRQAAAKFFAGSVNK